MTADVVDLEPDDGDVAREVLGWAAVAAFGAGASLGLALTAGWVLRAAYGITRDPLARAVAGLPW